MISEKAQKEIDKLNQNEPAEPPDGNIDARLCFFENSLEHRQWYQQNKSEESVDSKNKENFPEDPSCESSDATESNEYKV